MYLLFLDGLRCNGCKENAALAVGRSTCGYCPVRTALLLSGKIALLLLFCREIKTMEDHEYKRNGLQRKQKPSIRKRKTLQGWQ